MKNNIIIILFLLSPFIACGTENSDIENLDKSQKNHPNILQLENFNSAKQDSQPFNHIDSVEMAKNVDQTFYNKSLIADTQNIAFFTARKSNVILKNTGLDPVDISYIGVVDDPNNPLSENSAEKFEIFWEESKHSLSPGKDLRVDIEYIHPSDDLSIAYLVILSNAQNNEQIVVTLTVKCVGPDCQK